MNIYIKILYIFINYFLLNIFKPPTIIFQKSLYHFFAKLTHSFFTLPVISFHLLVFDNHIIEATAHPIINHVINLSNFLA